MVTMTIDAAKAAPDHQVAR
jgi:hypothetical protein